MSDIRAVADRILAMRDGQILGLFEDAPLDCEGAVTAMLGHKMTDVDISPGRIGAPILELRNVQLAVGSPKINFTVGKGEVVALTGLLGSGKSRISSILFGLEEAAGGEVFLEKKKYYAADPQSAMRQGVHMSPKDRTNNAIIPGFDIEANLILPFTKMFSNFGFTNRKQQRLACDQMIDTISIVCQSGTDNIDTLSGGNQQKVIIGRWLNKTCRLLLLDEPFQGVDIQARRDIGAHIRATCDDRGTLVFVSEIDEALEIADRIIVLHEQEIVGQHVNKDVDLISILSQVSGKSDVQTKVDV
jgi:simple sugar transport system ATP-binding protein